MKVCNFLVENDFLNGNKTQTVKPNRMLSIQLNAVNYQGYKAHSSS